MAAGALLLATALGSRRDGHGSRPTGGAAEVRDDEDDRVRALTLVDVRRVLEGRHRRGARPIAEVPRPGERAAVRRRRQVREGEVRLLLLAARGREDEVGRRWIAERR